MSRQEPPPPPRRATYEDLMKVPDHLVAEIIDGVLYTSPRPAPKHALATTALSSALLPPFQWARGGGPGGWVLLIEPELHFADDVLVPDLAGWRSDRMTQLPDTAYFTLAPDWVCEVLSPSTAKLDRTKKLRVYARERVTHTWILDPLKRTLEVLTRDSEGWALSAFHTGEDVCVRAVPFDAIELELPVLWSPFPPGGPLSTPG